jgi:glycosyltransferase involved in cell wall biosynthesis
VFARSLQAADHYIAISGSVAEALQTQLGIAADRITVVHHGVNPIFFSPRRTYTEAEKDIDLLFVSNIAHRKNILPLLKAVERLSRLGRPARLVIIGRILEEEPEVLRKLQDLLERGLVIMRSGLSEDELADTYARAKLFISSSLDEGFGMPALEAMATGTPVVLSAIPVYQEIAGDHAVFFDPLAPEDLFEAIDALLGDPDHRQRLAARNKHHSERFSWDQCAQRTFAVYERLL